MGWGETDCVYEPYVPASGIIGSKAMHALWGFWQIVPQKDDNNLLSQSMRMSGFLVFFFFVFSLALGMIEL